MTELALEVRRARDRYRALVAKRNDIIVDAALSGAKTTDLAKQYGVTPQRILNLVWASGHHMRSPGSRAL